MANEKMAPTTPPRIVLSCELLAVRVNCRTLLFEVSAMDPERIAKDSKRH